MKKLNYNLSEISAELLLGYLYPELAGQWMARHSGTFYRNYNSDVMAVYEDEPTVVLSRDGFLQLLPQGLFAHADKRQMQVLKDAFLPIDAFWFNTKVQLELQVSPILTDKLTYILKEYFRFDLSEQTNAYVRQAAVLLPFVRSKRGDFRFIRDLISSLVHCPVEIRTGRYSDSDSTVSWLPEVRYTLRIEGLTNTQYNERYEALQPLFEFIRQWLIPMEVACTFTIQDNQPRNVGQELTLNYNTQLV